MLRTQQANAGNIRAFADGMAQLTGTLRTSDQDIRTILAGRSRGHRPRCRRCSRDLEPTFPILLSNLVTINEVTAVRLPNLEQLLVTYPVIISSGFTGTHPGRLRPRPPGVHQGARRRAREGYLPPSQWRPADDLSDGKVYLKAHCDSPPPYAIRGANYVPEPQDGSSRVAPYDPRTGSVVGAGRQLVLD